MATPVDDKFVQEARGSVAVTRAELLRVLWDLKTISPREVYDQLAVKWGVK